MTRAYGRSAWVGRSHDDVWTGSLMGTWSGESFGNDTAADWAGDLVDDGSLATIRETLLRAADTAPDDDLDNGEACEAVAAAAGRSLGPDPYSEDALAWGNDLVARLNG